MPKSEQGLTVVQTIDPLETGQEFALPENTYEASS